MFCPLPYWPYIDQLDCTSRCASIDGSHAWYSARLLTDGGAVQVADGLAVVGKLREVLPVVGVLDPGRHREIRQRPPRVVGVRLQRGGAEHLVEVRQRRVDPGAGIRRRLIAIGRRVLGPEPGAEHAGARHVGHGQVVAVLAIAVQLVGGARRRDASSCRCSSACCSTASCRPCRRSTSCCPSSVLNAEVLEVGRDRVEVVLVVQRRRRIVGHQEVVAELLDLRAGRSLLIRRVALQMHDRRERAQRGVRGSPGTGISPRRRRAAGS